MISRWLTDNTCLDYYPASKNSPNYYAVFSPSLDRFLLVDNTCPWLLFKVAQIISSKISTVTFILNDTAKDINNENCLYYGTKHKKNEHTFGGSNPGNHKQSASMHPFYNNEVVEKGWPEEYSSEDRIEMVYNAQKYAQFTLRVVQSIKIAYSFRNVFPDSHYLEEYFKGQFDSSLCNRYDGTQSSIGMYKELTYILYHENTIDEALIKIHECWKKYSKMDVTGMREMFYRCLGINQPDFKFDLDDISNNYTLWVV